MITSLFSRKPRYERRYSSRLKTYNLVLVTDPAGDPTMMNLADLSTSGMQFSYPEALPTNKVVDIRVNLAELNCEVTVKGRVIWSRSMNRHSHLYRVGISFVEVNQDSWRLLNRFLATSKAA